jgi:hypothetical protein
MSGRDRFDDSLENVFALQDDVAVSVADAIASVGEAPPLHFRAGIPREAARIDRATEERLATRHTRARKDDDPDLQHFHHGVVVLERHLRHVAAG